MTEEQEHVIYIGNKPLMSYVTAVMTHFATTGAKHIKVAARGRQISKAVDIVEIIRNRFLKDVKLTDIKIGTDNVEVEGGKQIGVSTIELMLEKE